MLSTLLTSALSHTTNTFFFTYNRWCFEVKATDKRLRCETGGEQRHSNGVHATSGPPVDDVNAAVSLLAGLPSEAAAAEFSLVKFSPDVCFDVRAVRFVDSLFQVGAEESEGSPGTAARGRGVLGPCLHGSLSSPLVIVRDARRHA